MGIKTIFIGSKQSLEKHLESNEFDKYNIIFRRGFIYAGIFSHHKNSYGPFDINDSKLKKLTKRYKYVRLVRYIPYDLCHTAEVYVRN